MGDTRFVEKVMKGKPTIEGAGVHLKRAFGYYQVPRLDPFLLMDDFHSDNPEFYIKGFPWHPHRGIETITYMLDGTVEHGDSMGNRGVIMPGDVQWMTAGSGIIHQEMPRGDASGLMHGFQLWANLPAKDKMMDPRYREVKAREIPAVGLGSGVTAKVICGSAGGVSGPVRDIVTDPEYMDVTVEAGTTFRHGIRRGYTAFAYVVEGGAYFDRRRDSFELDVVGENYFDFRRECLIGPENLVLYGDGDEITVETADGPCRFLLASGRPIGEPVAWYGPIVMNTREELKTAFDEYNNGTFIKHG
ncbi:MAG: pirin family protein [Nitrospirae bacterium]|nr:pirin family protein [Nitrospirota bacterium]